MKTDTQNPTQHTPGTMYVEEQADIDRGGNGYRFALKVHASEGSYAQNPAYASSRANADRLALRWNCHKELLAALQSIVALDDGDRMFPQEFAEEFTRARAAIAMAGGAK